jgi:superoxide reductase
MAKRLEVYKCEMCGNIVEVLHGGVGKLVCCGQEMKVFEEKTADSSTEKHVPVIEKIDGGYKVVVGSTPHPMEEKHFIEWIQLISGDASVRAFLKPGDAPEAVFKCDFKDVSAREYCNVHGLWKEE